MHDWMFVSLFINWKSNIATFSFLDQASTPIKVTAEKLKYLEIPRREPWGTL